jgi:hypothetical protein
MPRNKKTANESQSNGTQSPRLRPGSSNRDDSVPASSKVGGCLRLPRGEADIEALRSVTREWLVPRLVEKFLRVHGVELKHTRKFANVANRLQPSLPGEVSLMSAGAVSKGFRPQAKKKNQYRELM